MPQPSPYTPGEVARDVPGRVTQLADFEERLSFMVDLGHLVGRIHVDHAPRGLGKTSLLRQYETRARERGVQTIWVTAGETAGIVEQVVDGIRRLSGSWSADTRRTLSKHLDSMTLSVGVPGVAHADVTVRPRSRDASPTGARAFEDLVRAVVDTGDAAGLIILIDELQAADAEGLRTILYAWQHLQAEGADVPAAVFAAGLPNSPDVITSVITFSERVAFRPLESLSREAEEVALRRPASALGVGWAPDAVDAALDIADGYPYALQLIADSSWRAAGRPDAGQSVSLEHVRLGESDMQHDLIALFRSRWASATSAEQALMSAMAEIADGPVSRAALADRLGVTPRSLSVVRGRLIDKGLIEPVARGYLGFTIPGFARFVRELDT